MLRKISYTRKKKFSTARDDVVTKKVFRGIKDYFDFKLDELCNYKKLLNKEGNQHWSILYYTDLFVQLNFD
jgi:hypothetical protein